MYVCRPLLDIPPNAPPSRIQLPSQLTSHTPSPGNGISTRNSLISSLDLDSPQKFSLDWYLFLNGCLQITLIQIYFWYYKKVFKAISNMEASFFSKPLSQSECRIKITSQLLSKSECRNLGHDLTEKTQTNKMAEAQHNADKHYFFLKSVLVW